MNDSERRQLLQPTEDLFETFRSTKYSDVADTSPQKNKWEERRRLGTPGNYAVPTGNTKVVTLNRPIVVNTASTNSPEVSPHQQTTPWNNFQPNDLSSEDSNLMMLTMESPFELPTSLSPSSSTSKPTSTSTSTSTSTPPPTTTTTPTNTSPSSSKTSSPSSMLVPPEIDFDLIRTSIDNLFAVFDLPRDSLSSPSFSTSNNNNNNNNNKRSNSSSSSSPNTVPKISATQPKSSNVTTNPKVSFVLPNQASTSQKSTVVAPKVASPSSTPSPQTRGSSSPRNSRTMSRSNSLNAAPFNKIVAPLKKGSSSAEKPSRSLSNELKMNETGRDLGTAIGVNVTASSVSSNPKSNSPRSTPAPRINEIKNKRRSYAVLESDRKIVSGLKSPCAESPKSSHVRVHSGNPTPQLLGRSGSGTNLINKPSQQENNPSQNGNLSQHQKSNSTPLLPTLGATPNAHIKIGQKAGRNTIINEMLETERSYLRDLNMIINVFKKPLQHSNLIPEDAMRTIFANIEMISTISSEFLTELEFIISLPEQEQCVGKIFLDKAQFLKGYKLYCANFTTAQSTLKKYKDEVPAFSEFLDSQAQSNIKVRGLSIFDFIIKPVQRVCKYPLFLMELSKHTPKEHSDYVYLRQALQTITNIVNEINETKRFQENQAKLMQIQQSFVQTTWGGNEPLNIMHPKRVLVKEGELKRVKKGKTKKYYYYQFNDLLLIGTLTKGKYSLSRMIPFNEINLSQRQDKINVVEFTYSGEKYVLEFSVPTDKNVFLTGVTSYQLDNSQGITLS